MGEPVLTHCFLSLLFGFFSCFQNNVEIHVAHIQSGLSQLGNLHAFAANNTNADWANTQVEAGGEDGRCSHLNFLKAQWQRAWLFLFFFFLPILFIVRNMWVHGIKHKPVKSLKAIFHRSTTQQLKSRGLFIGFYVPNMGSNSLIVSIYLFWSRCVWLWNGVLLSLEFLPVTVFLWR